MKWRGLVAGIVLGTMGSAFGGGVQPYPERPIHLLIGLPAGGGADAIARFLAAGLGDALGHPVVVENRTGSNGLIAAEAVAKSTPDGYTLLFGGVTTAALMPALGGSLSFDPLMDLAPVSLVATLPMVLVVGNATPARTVGDLLELARAHPGQMNYASSGNGSALHLSMEMFKSRTGLDATHIPYKGGVQAIPDLLSGQIHAMFEILPTELANIKAGKVRALAVTSPRRNPLIPDVPTMAEAGVPGFEAAIWYAVFAPAHTPPTIIEELNTQIATVLRSSKVHEHLQQLGAEAKPSTPQDALRLQRVEIQKWTDVIRRAGVRLD